MHTRENFGSLLPTQNRECVSRRGDGCCAYRPAACSHRTQTRQCVRPNSGQKVSWSRACLGKTRARFDSGVVRNGSHTSSWTQMGNSEIQMKPTGCACKHRVIIAGHKRGGGGRSQMRLLQTATSRQRWLAPPCANE